MSGAQDIRARGFSTALLGYDRGQVDAFREEMAAVVDELALQVSELGQQLRDLERAKPITADQAFANVARETQRILQAAQDAGARMLQQARERAENELARARREHAQIVGDGYRTRDKLTNHLTELDQTRARLLRRLYDASAEVERVCVALESQAPAATAARRVAADELVEQSRTGTDLSRGPLRSEPTLRVVTGDAVDQRHTRTQRPGAASGGAPHGDRHQQLAPLRTALDEQLREELRRVSDRLRERLRQTSDQAAVGEIAFDAAALAAPIGLADTLAGRAFILGASAAAAERDGLEPATRDEDRNGSLASVFDQRIGAGVRAVLEHAAQAQDPPWAVAERIDGVISDASEAMVAEIAEMELSRAYERGKLATWSKGGVAARHWVRNPQGHRRDERCRHNQQAGAVALAEVFPSGDLVPPRVNGCTCTTSATQESDP